MEDKIDLQGCLIMLHGPPGVGKTQLASKFPSPHYWFTTEPGHKFIPSSQQKTMMKLPAGGDGWDTFVDNIDECEGAKTVVIDTISGLFDNCMEYVCKSVLQESHPADAPHGKGWDLLKREFYRGLNKLSITCDKNGSTLILICHTKEVEIQTALVKKSKLVCDLTGTARRIIMPVPDHIWFMGFMDTKEDVGDLKAALEQGTERCLYLDGSMDVEAKCRDTRVKRRYIASLSKQNPYKQILSALNRKKTTKVRSKHGV